MCLCLCLLQTRDAAISKSPEDLELSYRRLAFDRFDVFELCGLKVKMWVTLT